MDCKKRKLDLTMIAAILSHGSAFKIERCSTEGCEICSEGTRNRGSREYAKAEHDIVEAAIGGKDSEIHLLRNMVASLHEEKDKWKAKFQDTEKKLAKASDRNSRLDFDIDQLERHNTSANQELRMARQTMFQLAKNIGAAKAVFSNLPKNKKKRLKALLEKSIKDALEKLETPVEFEPLDDFDELELSDLEAILEKDDYFGIDFDLDNDFDHRDNDPACGCADTR